MLFLFHCRNNPKSKHLSIGRKKFNMDPKKVRIFFQILSLLESSWIVSFSSAFPLMKQACTHSLKISEQAEGNG